MSTLFDSFGPEEVAQLRATVSAAVKSRSLRAVADEVGVSHTTLHTWIGDEPVEPSPRTLEKVARWVERRTEEREAEDEEGGSDALYRHLDEIEAQPVDDLVKAVKVEALSAAIRAEAAWMEARAAVIRARAIERAEIGAEKRASAMEREAERASDRVHSLQPTPATGLPTADEARRAAREGVRGARRARRAAGTPKRASGE